jgi:hypothetical protein
VGRSPARLAALAGVLLLAAAARAQPPAFVPVPSLPDPIRELAGADRVEAFALAPGIALVAVGSGEPNRSVIRAARGNERPQIAAGGRVVGLAVLPTGEAWAIVRESDRKGIDRRASLVAVDVAQGRVGRGVPLPVSAQGLAVVGRSLLVTSADEIRTFRLPDLTSGPLYRVPGPNVGVGETPWGETVWIVAQSEKVGFVHLDRPQGREGLLLEDATPAPVPLQALSPDGAGDLIALAVTGDAWKLEMREPPQIPVPVPLPVPHETPPVPPPPPTTAPAVEAETAPPPEPTPAPTPVPTPTPSPTPAPVTVAVPQTPGSIAGTIVGDASGSIAEVRALGPDNVLKEAARTRPDGGSYRFEGLAPGTYRIVAVGVGGRVVICDPPYLTVRLDGSQPVSAPELRAVRVP